MHQEPWTVQLLGGLSAQQAECTITKFFTYKIGGLFAYLAHYCHKTHAREELIGIFWPDAEQEAGRISLRTALSTLRKQLEPEGVPPESVLFADRHSVQLLPESLRVDTQQFDHTLKVASRAANPVEQIPLLLQAISLYRGELLPGYYEDWVLTERNRLSEAYLSALRRCSALLEEQGDLTQALEYARRVAQANALDEAAHEAVIRLYVRLGQMSAAQRHYQEFERTLRDELDSTPEKSLTELVQEARAQPSTPEVERQRKPDTVIGSPEIPVASLVQPSPENPPLVTSLPVPLTPFFGREEEFAQIEALLDSPDTRLITLTGLGGSGKTRLAIEVGRRIDKAERQRVCFVSLADLTDIRLIGETIRQNLRLPIRANIEPLEQVAEYLHSQTTPTLLVLDNFEQLVEEGAVLVRRLLDAAPTLCCLITSRLVLGLTGEQEFPVAPLPTPSAPGTPEHLLEFASVRLFVSRAQAARPSFEITPSNAQAVAQVCRSLEGIPLALELAAARVQALTPAQMLQQVTDRFRFLVGRQRDTVERHRTLRAALEWSYQALDESHQRLLAGLSVFRGGWTAEGAEAIYGEAGAFEMLLDLRDASLILTEEAGEEMRFRMLETVREYGWERLTESGERETLQKRHRDYFCQRAVEAKRHLYGTEQTEWAERLDRDFDNIRSAVAFCRDSAEEGEAGLRLIEALVRFCYVRGHYAECWEMCQTMLAHPTAQERTRTRAQVLIGSSVMAEFLGRMDSATAHAEEALEIQRELGGERDIAVALQNVGILLRDQGRYTETRELLSESLALLQATKESFQLDLVLAHLAIAVYMQGEYETARSLLEESLTLGRKSDKPGNIAFYLDNLGTIACALGEYEKALALHEEGVMISREIGDKTAIISLLLSLGEVKGKIGDEAGAHVCIEECLSLAHPLGHLQALAEGNRLLGDLFRKQNKAGDACSHYRQALTFARNLDNPLYSVRIVEGAASVLATIGNGEAAAQLWAAVERLRETRGAPLPPNEQEEYQRNRNSALTALGTASFESAWATGRKMTWEEATDFAGRMCDLSS